MRKAPRQSRSREMVQRLLDATAATIAERGLDNTTTNHVAERAGVSIGSLYQYFPHKEALIEALLERMGNDIGNSFRERAETIDISTLSLRELASLAISFGMMMIRNDPLFSELTRHWSQLPIDKLLDPLERFFVMMAQPYFIKHYQDYPVQNLDVKLYVLINSTLFTTLRYLQGGSPIRERQLVDTLTDMIVNLLEVHGSNNVAPKPLSSPGAAPVA